ncbi:PREDICTED: uncharacterized protein LOC109476859 [Paramuricea clavata]|uniref:PREDICTED: uncharacterized protein LOC109476859 n=1 Tax=Paramuricea clavata TaxID=317549 RepID=A0A6S7GKB8_PARCT|nr:PREDICTED: uncharacterized protein LOC109476859 [Paramuricea clavata]
MSSQVKELVSKCSVCNTYQPKQCKEPLLSHDSPALPWSKVGVDLFIYENRNYVITVDYFSNFFEVDYLTSATTTAVVKKLKEQFSRHGIPETVFTDNGPQFVCKEFREFSNEWEFKHLTSSPRYPQSNGKVENSVKTSDVHLALLEFRNTPSERDGVSPSQKLFSIRTRTCLPTTKDLLKPRVIDAEKVVTGAEQAKEKQKENYDVKARVLVPLEAGEIVRMRLPKEQKWSLGTCIKQVGPRNRRHIRKTAEKFRDSGRPSDSAECQTFCKPIVSTSNSMTGPENPVLLRRSTRDRKPPDRYQA